jgi:NTE family protein
MDPSTEGTEISSGNDQKTHVALVLPGGGARAAFQAGVLQAIGEILGDGNPGGFSPFDVICGTSAGAINAAVIGSHAHEYPVGVERLVHFWSTMYCERIYRTDALTVLRSGLRWAFSLLSGGRLVSNPKSLLDNRPLRQFLDKNLRLDGVQTAIDAGALRGLSVSASGYTCAAAISFYQAADDIAPWERPRRIGEKCDIAAEHLLASAALPLLFPAEQIGNEYFGDGGMRMVAPLSPAIHLGADRILIIATRDENPDPKPDELVPYPSLGQIGGYLLDTVFMDTTNADIGRLQRINRTLSLMNPDQRKEAGLKEINTLVIRPSVDLRDLTRNYADNVPAAVRVLLRSLGGWGSDWRMISYLLFDAEYCSELIRLGYQDGMAARRQVVEFFQT